eukprot:7385762-Prymnesium_polylepis.1
MESKRERERARACGAGRLESFIMLCVRSWGATAWAVRVVCASPSHSHLRHAQDTSGDPSSGEDGPHDDMFVNAFETMWAVFWIVTTLGYDGYLGSGSFFGRLI